MHGRKKLFLDKQTHKLDSCVHLIKQVKCMCLYGYFYLTYIFFKAFWPTLYTYSIRIANVEGL
jgi:hypothetical protein